MNSCPAGEEQSLDIRSLQYYLAVVREGTISAAAQSMHVAQPSLSRQMKELEEELGAPLFVRGNRQVTLTEEGRLLCRRAEELLRLMQKTTEEIAEVRHNIAGIINLGAGESQCFHLLSQTAAALIQDYPQIRFHIKSGDTQDLLGEIADGLIDFAVIFTEADHRIFAALPMPLSDTLGVLLPAGHELTFRDHLSPGDLRGYPLILPRAMSEHLLANRDFADLKVVATYNLIYNASLLVEDGVGLALGFAGLINTSGSPLVFRPLKPSMQIQGRLIWKKYQVLSPAGRLFLDTLQKKRAGVLQGGRDPGADP